MKSTFEISCDNVCEKTDSWLVDDTPDYSLIANQVLAFALVVSQTTGCTTRGNVSFTTILN